MSLLPDKVTRLFGAAAPSYCHERSNGSGDYDAPSFHAKASLVLGLSSILGGLLVAATLVALVGLGNPGGAVSEELLVVGGDSGELSLDNGNGLGENLAGSLVGGGARLDLLGGGVVDETLLDLTVLPGEKDELGFVSIESINVQLELLLAS